MCLASSTGAMFSCVCSVCGQYRMAWSCPALQAGASRHPAKESDSHIHLVVDGFLQCRAVGTLTACVRNQVPLLVQLVHLLMDFPWQADVPQDVPPPLNKCPTCRKCSVVLH